MRPSTHNPTLALGVLTGTHHARRSGTLRYALLASGAVLALALVYWSIDLVVCLAFPVGTHFIYHLLNGVEVYLAARTTVGIWSSVRVTRSDNRPLE